MKKVRTYIKTNDGNIYKSTSSFDIFLKMTPWVNGEDRRKSREELITMICNGNAEKISFNNARKDINIAWNKITERVWEFDGVQYKATNETFSFQHSKPYEFEHKWTSNFDNIVRTYTRKYFICMFHGKLYWVSPSQYYPQMLLYHFEGIDKEPNWDTCGQWTNFKNLKPIYKLNNNGKWENV